MPGRGRRRGYRREHAGKSLRDLRVAEVVEQDLTVGDGGEITYRTKLRLSFKYESGE